MKSILYEFTPDELQALLDTSDSYSDLLRKVGINPKGGNPKTLKRIISEYNLDETKLIENRKKLHSKNSIFAIQHNKKSIDDILSNKVPFYSSYNLLKRLIKEGVKDYKCESCGIDSWLGKPISLQLEHIDGNHYNNELKNLKVLCPNCHSQTDTFAGKNVDWSNSKRQQRLKEAKNKIKEIKMPPINRIELKNMIRTIPFIRIGEKYGVSDNCIRKWCVKYKLPKRAREIRKIDDEEWENI